MADESLLVELLIELAVFKLRVRQDRVSVLIILKGLVDGPPPPVLFEYLNNQLGIVSIANEALIKLKLAPLELQIDAV